MNLVVQTDELSFSYPNSTSFLYEDIQLRDCETLFVLGRSGSGKSTLLNLIAGFLHPATGKILVCGTDLFGLSTSQRDAFRGKNIGIVFQKNIFISSVNVWENLKWASYAAGLSFDPAHADSLLKKLGIEDKKSQKPHRLSQGEQQRVSIARALINKPKLILADEPTSALDDINALEVIELLKSMTQQYQASLIVVTHDRRIVTETDSVYRINESQNQ